MRLQEITSLCCSIRHGIKPYFTDFLWALSDCSRTEEQLQREVEEYQKDFQNYSAVPAPAQSRSSILYMVHTGYIRIPVQIRGLYSGPMSWIMELLSGELLSVMVLCELFS